MPGILNIIIYQLRTICLDAHSSNPSSDFQFHSGHQRAINTPFDRFEESDVRSEVENFAKEIGLEVYGLYFEKRAFIA